MQCSELSPHLALPCYSTLNLGRCYNNESNHMKITFLFVVDKQVSNVQSPWILHLLLDRLDLPVVVATGIAC